MSWSSWACLVRLNNFDQDRNVNQTYQDLVRSGFLDASTFLEQAEMWLQPESYSKFLQFYRLQVILNFWDFTLATWVQSWMMAYHFYTDDIHNIFVDENSEKIGNVTNLQQKIWKII